MATILGQNQYGKAENRVVKITRDGDTHHIKDLNVSVALSGDMDDVHYSGSNANVLPTDTTKNTVYAFAKEYGIESAEQFGIHLARWFVNSQEPIQKARIRIEEYSWSRIATSDANSKFIGSDEVNHSFVRNGGETRVTQITYDGKNWEVISGLKDLVVMNSTNSEFWGYVKDKYTTLKEAYDRILATQVSARWRFSWSDDDQRMPNWEKSYAETRKHMLQAFAETYSLSLQQTLYQMGSRIINHRSEIDEVRFSLPNKHHFLVDLEPFGLKNDNEVYFAADRPYGLIEATVLRDGVDARIPVDMTNL
ncbi:MULTISPECIES: factor-independent urate hydroxylase [unclassified Streptomyces]|uniref:factor-independent urate hydroxylase n=1 Tax=unclassified Streptomyces TaxID=2593676 RepID=UPI0020B75818|nr:MULTISPECIES: urate oxidase [unclassified Streptomyces]MDT0515059.1 urate oxidase [Streptomyces sp. DSM 41633]MCP3754109.1 urate oxidase [Streptomyces sp. TBY4]MCX5193570.1 urate oxidase [Streptomyces sp. NBC_00249]MCX5375041.1 urate oxidase [Streptomyces sp. NBC_00091]WSP93454.1 urate oxidase [Streptomyces sp. NBC_01233]